LNRTKSSLFLFSEYLRKLTLLSRLPAPLVVGVACKERQHSGRFGKDHLLTGRVHFPPGLRLLQCGA